MNASSVRPQTKFAAALVAAGVVSAAIDHRGAGEPQPSGAQHRRGKDVGDHRRARRIGRCRQRRRLRSGMDWRRARPRCRSMPRMPSPSPRRTRRGPERAVLVGPAVRQPILQLPELRVSVSSQDRFDRAAGRTAARWDRQRHHRRGERDLRRDQRRPRRVLPSAIPASYAMEAVPGHRHRPHRPRRQLCRHRTRVDAVQRRVLPGLSARRSGGDVRVGDPRSERDSRAGEQLVYGLLSPDATVRACSGTCLFYTTQPFTTLPGPIGELANNTVTAIADGVNSLLSLLPPPISPTAIAHRPFEVRPQLTCRMRRSRPVPSRC